MTGAYTDGTNYDTRASFNPIGGTGLSSSSYQGRGVSPYTSGAFGPAPVTNTYYGRASFYSGNSSSGGSYQSRSSFDALAGAGSTSAYQGRGITPYINGVVSGSSNPYSGPTGETTVNYTYGAGSAGPHAVTSLSNGNTYSYDANGNMTQRVEGSTTWTQTFDAENRLVSVSDGTTTTTYTYDHAGNRVRRAVTSGGTTTTTIYVAGMEIERVGGTETERTIYYSAGGAFRIVGGSNAGLYYRHTDHLGSTSVLSNASGQKVTNSEIVFAPFGEVRTGSLPTLTDFGYTGQRHDGSTGGLMYYGARYYLPGIRRFISPDTMIPGMGNPQTLNRYSYVLNRSINFADPTGHVVCPADMTGVECEHMTRSVRNQNPNMRVMGSTSAQRAILNMEYEGVHVRFSAGANVADETSDRVIEIVNQAVDAYAGRLREEGLSFRDVMQETTVRIYDTPDNYLHPDPDANYHGYNDPVRNSNGNIVGFNISLELDRVLGVGPEHQVGVRLVAHEFAHNLTYQGFNYTEHWGGPEGIFGVDASSVNIPTYDDPATTDKNEDNYANWAAEQSADAFASWALQDYNPNWSPLTVAAVDNEISCLILPTSCQ